MSALTHEDPMPFGKHKGTPMKDVPASYLFYLWTNGISNEPHNPVFGYINDNIKELEQSHPDGIWREKIDGGWKGTKA